MKFIISGIVIITMVFSCGYGTRNIEIKGDLKLSKVSKRQIRNAVSFTEGIIEEYEKLLIEKSIPDEYQEEFLFHNSRYKAEVLISSDREIILNVLSNEKKKFIIYPTKFPAYLAFLAGKEEKASQLDKELGKATIEAYRQSEPQFVINDPTVKLVFMKGGGGVQNENVPISKKGSRHIHYFNDIFFHYLSPITGFRNDRKVDNLLVISANTEFIYDEETLKNISKGLVENEIQNLIIKSPFFNKALAHNELKPIATSILGKKSRSQKDNSFEYPTWEFQKNVYELKEKANAFGIKSEYVDALLGEAQYEPKDGNLLWYYSDYFGFSMQWALINLLIIPVIIITFLLKYIIGDIPYMSSILGGGLVFAINGYILVRQKPVDMPLTYIIIPGLVMMISIMIMIYFELKEQRR